MAHTFTRFYVDAADTIDRAEFIERLRALAFKPIDPASEDVSSSGWCAFGGTYEPGVGDPDLVIWDTPPAHPDRKGMCVEMKIREKAPKTDRAMRWAGAEAHQRARLEVLERAGFLCVVCYGADDAIEKIRAAGYPLPLMPRVAR